MLKIFSNLLRRLDGREHACPADDPLAHPAIAAMDERQVADLPLRPFRPAEPMRTCGCDGAVAC